MFYQMEKIIKTGSKELGEELRKNWIHKSKLNMELNFKIKDKSR